MRYISIFILLYIWLITGRADPGDLLQYLPVIRWLTYLLIPMLLLIGSLYIVTRGKYKKTFIDKPVLLLLFLMTLSTYLNDASLTDLFYGIGVYLRYPLLFILLLNIPRSTSKGREFLFTFCMIVVLLALEAVFNFIVYSKQGDTTFFTIGSTWGTANAGVFFVVMISLMTAHALLTGIRSYHVFLLALIVITASIASIRTVLIVSVPIIFIVFAIYKRWLNISRLVGMAITITLLVFAATFIDWHVILSTSPVLSRFDPGYRLEFIREVLLHIPDMGNLFLGAGPRSLAPGTAGSAGVLYKYFLEYDRHVINLGSNQYVKSLAELGIAGLLVYYFLLYRILKVAWLNWCSVRTAHSAPLWFRVLNLGFFGIWIFYACVGLISNDLWRMDASSLIFWFFAAVLAVAYRDKQIAGFRFPVVLAV